MPFKSQAQRGFMYAKHPKLANEFEAATPEGAKLPEHVAKMADGGEVEGSSVAQMIDDLHNRYIRSQGDNGNLKGLQDVASSSDTVKGYADGGDVQPQPFGVGGQSGDGQSNLDALMSLIKSGGVAPAMPGMQGSLTQNLATSIGQGVTAPGTAGVINNGLGTNLQDAPQAPPQPDPNVDQSFIDTMNNAQNGGMDVSGGSPVPQKPQGQPSADPSLSDTASALNKTPSTNYDFYGDVGSDKRAALYKQLLDQQRSPGNLAAQAVGGIGDAISNSFGGQHNNFQNEARDIAAKNTENRIGSVDTQRTQKMQDMNANIEMQMNDPNSRIAKSMQSTLKSAGLNVPGGMPPSVMLKVAGPLGELAFKQAQIQETAQYHGSEVANKKQGLAQQEWEYKTSHPILNAIGNAMDGSGSPQAAPPIGQPVKHASGAIVTKVK
jgi:hypothetical protein